MRPSVLCLLSLAALSGCHDNDATTPATADPDDLKELAAEAYVYGYPIVAAYHILHKQSLEPTSTEYKGPFNQYRARVRLMTASDRTIISPNADTPYGMANLDLREQGRVLTLPQVDTERYFSVQLVDMQTFNFAYLGKRTTLNRAGTYLICYSGNVVPAPSEARAAGIDAVIVSETPFVQLFSRTQLYDDADLAAVQDINDKVTLRPQSDYMPTIATGPAPTYDRFPDPSDECLATAEFYSVLDFVLSLCPAHPSEEAFRERLKGLGLDGTFDLASLAPAQKEALDYGLSEGRRRLETASGIDTRQLFGSRDETTAMNGDNMYLARALGAFYGIYGNTAAEALYFNYRADSNGEPLDAARHNYRLAFDANDLPPVGAFWSVTMYGADKFFVDNSLDRYLINSRMLDNGHLRVSEGRLTIHIRREEPADEAARANWLPAPAGPFILILRLYLPGQRALAGEWERPQVERCDGAAESFN